MMYRRLRLDMLGGWTRCRARRQITGRNYISIVTQLYGPRSGHWRNQWLHSASRSLSRDFSSRKRSTRLSRKMSWRELSNPPREYASRLVAQEFTSSRRGRNNVTGNAGEAIFARNFRGEKTLDNKVSRTDFQGLPRSPICNDGNLSEDKPPGTPSSEMR